MSRTRNDIGELKKPELCGIYRIVCKTTGKSLVGQTIHFNIRWLNHFREAAKELHANPHFQNSYLKYGKDNFYCEVLEVCSERDLNKEETKWILFYKENGGVFNLNSGGDACRGEESHNFGKKRSEESKAKMSESRLKKNISGDKCYQYGKKMPPEFGLAISLAKRKNPKFGKDHPHYGMKRSEESRRRMSQAQSNPELRAKVNAKLKETCSKDEFKAKMRVILQQQMRSVLKLDKVTNEIIDKYESLSEAARQNRVRSGDICSVCKGKRKTCGGFIWRYDEKDTIL